MGQFSHGHQTKVVSLSSLPFIIDPHQDQASQANNRWLIGKLADHIRPTLDLFVKAFQRIGRIDAGPMDLLHNGVRTVTFDD